MPGYTTLAAHHGATNAHDPLARIPGMKEAFRLCRQTRRRVGLYVHAGETGYEVRTVRAEKGDEGEEDGSALAEKEEMGWRFRVKQILHLA